MKRLFKWVADQALILCVIGAAVTMFGAVMSLAHEAGENARKAKRMQSQIAVESVRRGYAELVVNTNTGGFEVRLKEVAP